MKISDLSIYGSNHGCLNLLVTNLKLRTISLLIIKGLKGLEYYFSKFINHTVSNILLKLLQSET